MASLQDGWRQQWPSGLSAFTALSGQSSGLFTIQVTFPITAASGTVFAVPHGLPVTPQILFATISGRTETTDTSNRTRQKKGFGFAVKSGPLQSITQMCFASNSDDNVSSQSASDQCWTNSLVATMTSGHATVSTVGGQLSLIAVDSGVVTFQVIRQFDLAYIVQLHLIGGTDITRLDLREYSIHSGAVGLQSITSPGFKPDFIWFFGGHTGQSFGPGSINEGDTGGFIGAADINLNQWVVTGGVNDFDSGRCMSYMRSGECITHLTDTVASFDTHGVLTSMDPLGFTINWLKVQHDREWGALCIKGGNWAVGNFTTKTNTIESQVVNNLSFQPNSEFIFSACKPISAYDTTDANDQLSMGMAKSSTSNYVQQIFGQNFPVGVAAQGASIGFNSAYFETTMSGVPLSKFAVSSVQSNGFSIQHSLAASGTNFVGYIACAPKVTPPFSTVIKTVKPGGGGNYLTLVSGLASEIFNHPNLISENIILEFDCYPGIEFHNDDVPLTVHGWNESNGSINNIGYKTDATHYLLIKCINGHQGLFDASGATYLFDFVSPTGNQSPIIIKNEFTRFQQFQARITGVSGQGNGSCYLISAAGQQAPTDYYFINCIAKAVLISGAAYHGFKAGSSDLDQVGVKATHINCIAYDFLDQDKITRGFTTDDARNPDIRYINCTAYNCSEGLLDHSDVTHVNCLGLYCDNGWNTANGPGPRSRNNLSTCGPTTIIASGYLPGIIASDSPDAKGPNSINGVPVFIKNASIEDIRPKYGDPYLNNGVDGNSFSSYSFNTDVAGNLRTMPWTIGAFQNVATVAQDVFWAIAGGVTDTAAKIAAKLVAPAAAVYLNVSLFSNMSSPTQYGPVVTNANNTAIFTISVAALAKYYYQIVINGVAIGPINSFTSLPTKDTVSSFVFGCGGCADTGSNSNIYTAILNKNPLLFINYGDLHYMNIGINDITLHRLAFDTAMMAPKQQALYSVTAFDWMWDDHDFSSDNTDETSPTKPAAEAFYREDFPGYSLQVSDAIYHSFVAGRCRFILTDLRSKRDASGNDDPINGIPTIIDPTQLTWFKNELALAKQKNEVAFWFSTVPWIISGGTTLIAGHTINNDGNGSDSWGGFVTQRTAISDYIHSLNYPNIIIFCGDMHAAVIDDGTHDQYNSDGTGNNLTMFLPFPLNQTNQIYSGIWTQGPIKHKETRLMGMAGIVTVTDNINTISVKMDVINELQTLLTYTKVFTIGSGTSNIDLLSGTISSYSSLDGFNKLAAINIMSGTLTGGHFP